MNIDTDEDFPEHPKTQFFCALMEDENAWVYLWKLWRFCTKFQRDGDLSRYTPAQIEIFVGWRAKDGRFFKSAVDSGFIDLDDDGARVHNWMKRQGKGLVWQEIDRLRKTASKLRQEGDLENLALVDEQIANLKRTASIGRPGSVRGNSDGIPPEGSRTAGVPTLIRSRSRSLPDPDSPRARAIPDPVAEHEATPVVPPTPRARTQEVPAQEQLAAAPPRKEPPSGNALQTQFGEIRAEILGALPWHAPLSADGKASSFAARLTDDVLPDVERTMRLACEHTRDRTKGWDDERLKGATFLFGAWMAKFTDLREELHGVKQRQRQATGPPGPRRTECEFHAYTGAEFRMGKRAPRHDPQCAECRHVAAKNNDRRGEPTLIGDVKRGTHGP